MNYLQICCLLQHYTDMYNNPKDLVHKAIARQAMEHYKREWEQFNN